MKPEIDEAVRRIEQVLTRFTWSKAERNKAVGNLQSVSQYIEELEARGVQPKHTRKKSGS
jgi:hypothetical protein